MKQILQAVAAFLLVAGSVDFLMSRLLNEESPRNAADGPESPGDTTWIQPFVSRQIESHEGLEEEHRSALVQGTLMVLDRGCAEEDLREWGWTPYQDLAFTYCPSGGTPGRENQAYLNLNTGELYRYGLENDG